MKTIKNFFDFLKENTNTSIVDQIKMFFDNNKLNGIIIDKNENYPEKQLDANDYVIFIANYATGKKVSVYMKRDVTVGVTTTSKLLAELKEKFGGEINVVSQGTVNVLIIQN
jgi:hypothetical protein